MSSFDSTYHLGQAINLLNKRISNCDRETVTGATIFAVGSLANMQVIYPTRLSTTFRWTCKTTNAILDHN